MINWGTFMMEVSKTPSVLIGLVFTAITICLTIFNLWWSMRNRVEAEWTVSVTIPRNGSPSVRSRIRIRLTSTNPITASAWPLHNGQGNGVGIGPSACPDWHA